MPGARAAAAGPGGASRSRSTTGPTPNGTPVVLDALDAAGAKATFFLVGEQLMRHHAIAREAAARGHELALHCFEHVDHDALPPAGARDDVARGSAASRRPRGGGRASTGPRTGASPTPRTTPAATSGSSPSTGRPGGWTGSRSRASGRGLACRDLDDGAIVLLHDSPRYAPPSRRRADGGGDRARSPPRAAEQGLALVTLGDAAGSSPLARRRLHPRPS